MAYISKIKLPSGDLYDLKDLQSLRITTQFTSTVFSSITWTQGSISSSNGTVATSSTNRLHTQYLPPAVAFITPLDGYQFTLAGYNHDEVYQGMWNGTSFAKSATWFTEAVDLTKIGDYKFRVCMSRSPSTSASMDTSLGSNVVFTTSVDAMVYYQNFLLTKLAGFTVYDGTVV